MGPLALTGIFMASIVLSVGVIMWAIKRVCDKADAEMVREDERRRLRELAERLGVSWD